ncbi:MAG: aryl-sulfate sulfotransferase [Alphaproteobacteria bacterium]|nr:aryl-sulfate sulfotransferase [Alphaproteobacteria bacterium]
MKNFILGLCISYILIILIGSCFDNFVHKHVEGPIGVMKSLASLTQEPRPNELWFQHETTQEKGVITYDEEKSWGDYTLFTFIGLNKAVIIDMSGKLVYEWDITFSTGKPTDRYRVTTTRVFSDPTNRGNLYVMYIGKTNEANQCDTIKFDSNSNILWNNSSTFHHDMTFLEDGKYMTFRQTIRQKEHSGLPQIEPPFLEDYLVVVDNNDGKFSQDISFYDAFAKSEYKSVLESLSRVQSDPRMIHGDLLHPNTITLVPKHVSEAFDKITENSVMLSFRNIDMIAFLDIDTETITWAFYGPWRGQHDAKFLENGHVIMLDNQGHTGSGGRSRIIEVDLNDLSIVWEYGGSKDKPFYTRYNGMVEILPNDNILVTETHTGRIFEITRNKEIVWDYYVKGRIEYKDTTRIPSIVSARRFSKEELSALIVN